MQKFLSRAGPYFADWTLIDENVKLVGRWENEKLRLTNMKVSVENEYWTISKVGEVFCLHLSPALRRSALHLLSDKASYLSYSPELQSALRMGPSASDDIHYGLLVGAAELELLSKGIPDAWARFCDTLNLSVDQLIYFQGYHRFISKEPQLWRTKAALFKLWKQFLVTNGLPSADENAFSALIDLFAVDIEEGVTWGITVPFLRFKEWFMGWRFFTMYFIPICPSLQSRYGGIPMLGVTP